MALLLKKIISFYHYINEDLQDPRSLDYPMMSTPFPLIFILASYLYFVLSLGPKIMENRKPYNIKKFVMLFNLTQICLCGFLEYKFLTVCFFRINWRCEPIDYSREWYPSIQLFYSYVYHLIKILDLLDTIFFVLRKKNSQISFLHIYHHAGMVILTWIGVKFIGGGHGLFIGFANNFVHTVMYFYYFITIWDEKYKKSIWWKKYITQLQILQFFFLLIMFGQILFQNDCTYPKWVVIVFVPQNIFMMLLFSDFYYKAYIKKKPQETLYFESIVEKNAQETEKIK